ncbi:MAG: DUF5674 family protein [candidate division Zixibacteria bacterium]|nr:DUF5674 family protein [candidate division Zixibacteria bacterium]
MMHVIREKASPQQIEQMLDTLETYIKVAVDIRRKTLSGGGILHADCEAQLLADGSRQEDIWGADWYPKSQKVQFEALINIRPSENNTSMEIQNPNIRLQVEFIVRDLLGGVK